MPKVCTSKAEAVAMVGAMDDSEIPALFVVWNADEIKEAYTDEDDNPVLTDEEVLEVLHRLSKNFDADHGITNDRIWYTCDHVFQQRKEKT